MVWKRPKFLMWTRYSKSDANCRRYELKNVIFLRGWPKTFGHDCRYSKICSQKSCLVSTLFCLFSNFFQLFLSTMSNNHHSDNKLFTSRASWPPSPLDYRLRSFWSWFYNVIFISVLYFVYLYIPINKKLLRGGGWFCFGLFKISEIQHLWRRHQAI